MVGDENMRCQNCGRELKNGARFCIACGAQHDENGQLVGGGQNNQSSGIDYNKTMMVGSTGFQQYQPQQDEQNFQQYDYSNMQYDESANGGNVSKKKKISPIIIICPIIIIGALLFSLFSGKSKSKKNNNAVNEVAESTMLEESMETNPIDTSAKIEEIVATISEPEEDEEELIHLDGYWDAEQMHFYEKGKGMLTNRWINSEYYVGDDGEKVVNAWVDEQYYVDATGKRARNQWIEFTYYGTDGQKKIGFYYVGSNGKKVRDEVVEGRYINEEGCYFPNQGEELQNEEKKNDKINETIKETSAIRETTVQQTTIQNTTVYIPTVTVAVETQTQNIVAPDINIKNVDSNGNSISYQLITSSFPEENITKYVSVSINDVNYSNLAFGVAEWNENRERSGILEDQEILSDRINVTYDLNIERNDNKVFSLYETKTLLDNSIAYDKKRIGSTWDSKTGEELTIDKIFSNEENFEEFTDKVVSRIKSNKNSFDEDIYEELISGEEDIFKYCTWYMTESGITLVFNKENTGKDKIDGVTITLTYSSSGSNVNKLLMTKYRK